jgi:heptosyltransferase-2
MSKIELTGHNIHNILVLSLSGLGDTLMLTPSFKIVRRNFPNAKIVALVMTRGAYEILLDNKNIDELIYWNFYQKKFWRSLNFALQLRKRRFQFTFFSYPANHVIYNMLNFLIGSTWRPIHRYSHLNSISAGFLNHQVIHEDDNLHHVEENLRLLAAVGLDISSAPIDYELNISDHEKAKATNFIASKHLHGKRLIGFHAGCNTHKNHIHRRWGSKNFCYLGNRLKQNSDTEILVFGGSDELQLKLDVLSNMEVPGVSIDTESVIETAAIMAQCHLFVTNDSFLMHMASALTIPTVCIFGPTNPTWVGPIGTPHVTVTRDLECRPCFYYSPKPLTCFTNKNFECVRKISVTQIYNACERLLDAIDRVDICTKNRL